MVTQKPVKTKSGKSKLKKDVRQVLLPGEFEYPAKLYDGPIPMALAKFRDLQSLKKFLTDNAKAFYDNTPRH